MIGRVSYHKPPNMFQPSAMAAPRSEASHCFGERSVAGVHRHAAGLVPRSREVQRPQDVTDM